MNDLIAARSTMAFSLGFHIVFAAIGMTMPFFMCTAHYRYLRRGDAADLELTKMWMKGVAILFAPVALGLFLRRRRGCCDASTRIVRSSFR